MAFLSSQLRLEAQDIDMDKERWGCFGQEVGKGDGLLLGLQFYAPIIPATLSPAPLKTCEKQKLPHGEAQRTTHSSGHCGAGD